jgi:uncharacterized protein (TIGR00725 family)
MARRPVIGVVGTGKDGVPACEIARQLGERIAAEGWIVLSGGRNAGVMQAVNAGAKEMGGLCIGLLPDRESEISPHVDVAIITDLGNARNNLIALSSDILIAVGIEGAGTASEVALAIKNKKKVILIGPEAAARAFFKGIGGHRVYVATSADEAVNMIKDQKLLLV